jgi:anti-anti-sigma factor
MALTLTEREVTDTDAALVELAGAIDLHAIDGLERLLDGLRERGKTRVVLDLARIRYVNSSGFGVLVKHALSFEQEGGGLSLLGVPAKVSIVIEMLGIEQVFAVVCKHAPGAFVRAA